MERTDQLISDYFDGELTPADALELAQRLERDAGLRASFFDLYRQHRVLAVELGAFAETEFTAAILAELGQDQAAFVGTVMRAVKVQAPRLPALPSSRPARSPLWRRVLSPSTPGDSGRGARLSVGFWVALSACLLLGLGLGGFLMLRPEAMRAQIAQASPGVVIVRGEAAIPAVPGFTLHEEDSVQTLAGATATIKYRREPTEVTLRENTSLTFARPKRGKLLVLAHGQIEVTAGAQAAGRPMTIATPQARARVIGTQFTLAAKTASTWLTVTKGIVELSRTSDQRSIAVAQGHFAVAASGLELVSRPADGPIRPLAPQPVSISLFSESPERADWITTPSTIQQRQPIGPALRPYQVPPLAGSTLLEVAITVDSLATAIAAETGGWGFGVGLRAIQQKAALSLRSLQQNPRGSVLQFSDFNGAHSALVPFEHPPAGTYCMKLRVDRAPGQLAVIRGKMWPQPQPEPADWMLEVRQPWEGALETADLYTFNCACTFTQLRLSFIE